MVPGPPHPHNHCLPPVLSVQGHIWGCYLSTLLSRLETLWDPTLYSLLPQPLTPRHHSDRYERNDGFSYFHPSPKDSSLDHSSVLRVDVRAAQGFLLETRASWQIPRAPGGPPAPPGYLQAGPVSTAPLSPPFGASAQSHWGGRQHPITRKSNLGDKTGEAIPLLP